MTTTKAITFTMTLGAFSALYKVWETTAPVDYDGFGTITLHDGSSGLRWVLIREEHETWQTLRYRSGMFGAQPVTDEDVLDWVTDALHRKLVGGAQ